MRETLFAIKRIDRRTRWTFKLIHDVKKGLWDLDVVCRRVCLHEATVSECAQRELSVTHNHVDPPYQQLIEHFLKLRVAKGAS